MCADSQKLATFSAEYSSIAADFDRHSLTICRPSDVPHSRAFGRDSLHSSNPQSRPAWCRKRPAPHRSWSSIRVSGSAASRSDNNLECVEICLDHDRKSTLSPLRRRKILVRLSQAACPDTFPMCFATFQTAGQTHWWAIFRHRLFVDPLELAAAAVDVLQLAPTQ